MTDPTLISLSPCTIIRASGSDALRFLNGQLTNDVTLATSDQAIQAAALNAKGGLEAICWIRRSDDDFLIDAPLSLRAGLMERLDRYLIADDVILTDESDEWTLAHLLNVAHDAQAELTSKCSRFGLAGLDVLIKDFGNRPTLPALSEDQILDLRINNGIPAWDAELVVGMLPPEAGLQESAISYEKGCYLGQEVISRMKWAGKTNRHLIRLEVPSGIKSGTEFTSNGTVAGTITSVSTTSGGSESLALGFRKRKFEDQNHFDLQDQHQCVHVLERLS